MNLTSLTRGSAALLVGAALMAVGCTTPQPSAPTQASPAAQAPPTAASPAASVAPMPSGAPATSPAASGAPVQSGAPTASGAPAASPAASGAPALIKAHGKVTEIAPDLTRFTIAHDDIPELPMKAMTMPYRVTDAMVLQGIKPEQEVDFFIDNSKGELVVVKITPTLP